MTVRPARPSDAAALAPMRHALWPEGSVEEHRKEIEAIIAGEWSAIYPYVILVIEGVGFAEVTLRSRADGCDPMRPVGHFEGWYVARSEEHTSELQSRLHLVCRLLLLK